MDAVTQQKKLVDELIEKTGNGTIKWQDDPTEGDPFTKISDYFVIVQEGRNGNGATLYTVIIQNSSEREIDSFNDEDLDKETGKPDYYMRLSSLVNTARRQAKGSDKAIDDILRNLGEL